MKTAPVPEDRTIEAVHFANRDKVMKVVRMGKTAIRFGGRPAVLTCGPNDWYSAELVWDRTRWVAYAVNGYADRSTAISNAESRR